MNESHEPPRPEDPGPQSEPSDSGWARWLLGPRSAPIWAGACLMLLTLSVIQQGRFERRLGELQSAHPNSPLLRLSGGVHEAAIRRAMWV